MIFVTLGTQKFQLNRLLKLIDNLVEQGKITGEIFVQTGNSDYSPKNCGSARFLNKEEFDACISKADIVITHSGVGTIVAAAKRKKPTIVFPRLEKYNEHVDDHQLEIAKAFEKKGYALCCGDGDDLAALIEKCAEYKFAEYVPQGGKIIDIIEDFLKGV